MKVTKYPQSCLLIEQGETRIVVDPGSVFTAKYSADELGELDAVLYTHMHQDHLDKDLAEYFNQEGVAMYGNESVIREIEALSVTMVADNISFEVGSMTILPRNVPHCLLPDGSEGPPNTGYVINGSLFHPGDGTEINDLSVATIAAPMAGPDISPKDIFDLANSVNAKNIIPIHNDVFHSDTEKIKMFGERFGLNYNWIMLEDGESTEL